MHRRASARVRASHLAGLDGDAYGKGGGLPALVVTRQGARGLRRLGCGGRSGGMVACPLACFYAMDGTVK
jgi:hypothetical protein